MTHDVRTFDPADDTLLRGWWEVGAATAVERPIDAWAPWEAVRLRYQTPRADGRTVLVAALDAGQVVGAGRLFLFDHDNTHLGEIDVHVLPERRRHGIGRAVLAELERAARADGRTTLIASAFAPVGAESAGSLFAAATGFAVASHEETKVVDLRTAPASWSALDDEVIRCAGGYRVEVHDERVPDRHVDGFLRLLEAFLGEVPTGDLDLRPARWSVQRLRDHEDRAIATGTLRSTALAIAPDGGVAGFSDVILDRADPGHARVGATLVLPGHRGHRLGMAMKLASHRRVLERHPECAYVETGNAGVNRAMNGVNDRLGYRVVERCLDVQKPLA